MTLRDAKKSLLIAAAELIKAKLEMEAVMASRYMPDGDELQEVKELALKCVSVAEVIDSHAWEYQRVGVRSKRFAKVS